MTVCVHARRGKCFKQKPLISAIHYEFNSDNANTCSISDSPKRAPLERLHVTMRIVDRSRSKKVGLARPRCVHTPLRL